MAAEYVTSAVLLTGMAGLVALGFSFPALTDSGVSSAAASVTGSAGGGGSTLADIVAQEASFCRENVRGVNCICFAQTAGHIQHASRPKVSGFYYAKQEDLARGQAMRRC
jgi:hypothetical protein